MSYILEEQFLSVTENYICKGSDFGISSIKRISINIHHYSTEYCEFYPQRTFMLNVTIYRHVFGEGFDENCFSYDLTHFYDSLKVPKERFDRLLTKNLNKIRIFDKKALLSSKKFVDYVYDCLTKTIKRYENSRIYNFGL